MSFLLTLLSSKLSFDAENSKPSIDTIQHALRGMADVPDKVIETVKVGASNVHINILMLTMTGVESWQSLDGKQALLPSMQQSVLVDPSRWQEIPQYEASIPWLSCCMVSRYAAALDS